MKQMIISLDEGTARDLERVAPARKRQRSAFIRAALRRALDEAAEREMRAAYLRQPDDEPVYFDPRAWEKEPPGKRDPAPLPQKRRR
ncbi:MAG: hypothetical protein EXR72_15535 [Myxococcales bacterium]|nr:hypothetical protein [Myxococcales bacterium]